MSPSDRVNHFPASPLVSVSLIDCGELRFLPEQGDAAALPRLFAFGPTDHPVSSWAPGPVVALTVGIYHDAWLRLGGDREYSCLPLGLVKAFDQFAQHTTPETGWDAFCETLDPIWARQRTQTGKGIHGIADWTQAVVTRAALSGPGQSLRSIERRLKRFSGQTRRALDFYSSLENLQKVSYQNPNARLADVAIDAGYSDQSHMGRAVRRATGFSPAYINRAISTEEAFWCYRLLGERF